MCHSRDSSVSGHQEYLHQTAWLWLLMLIKLVLDQSGDWHAAICGAASVQELKMKSLHNAPDIIITTNDPFSFQNICQISSFFKKQNKTNIILQRNAPSLLKASPSFLGLSVTHLSTSCWQFTERDWLVVGVLVGSECVGRGGGN